ncbi:hypothetical protein Leryth_009586 [Lithospermum erythrorhizon]|nr:hypothetical protein Leryth_009586 [Lithospermum erythrorhizon]
MESLYVYLPKLDLMDKNPSMNHIASGKSSFMGESSLVDHDTIIGREDEKRELIERLTVEGSNEIFNGMLKGERFLLVLDNIWSEKSGDWDTLFTSLQVGCKVIVTTRSEVVASIVGQGSVCNLKPLTDDECWKVMEQKAFSNVNLIEDENMTEIGRNIAKKCKGLPLAAKTLGSVLYSKSSEQDWNSILESVFWDLPEDQNEIFTSLARSYHHLPAHLNKCFAYCSIFPRNYHFIMDDLVLLWMAEGFLLPRGQIRLEDIGNEYFMDLARRSFFHVLDVDGISKKIYVMHELIHDLSHLVSSNTCFPLEITYPESTTKLRGLQTLNLNACTSFFELPVNLKNLTNLHHLDLDVKHQLCRMPSHLGSLTKLQTLSAFIVGNEEEQSISELKNMQLLRGSICITNLDKVSSATEARGARLDEKPYIDKLVLEWEHTQTTGNISKEFLQNLKPHKNVKLLVIKKYSGSTFPFCLTDPLCRFGIIELQNCQNCKNIPSLGFLRFLKSLYIVCMPSLVSIGQEFCGNGNVTAFPVLETLILEDMQKLKEWKELDVNGMPNLRELTIMDCPSLISLPRLFASNSLHSLSVAQRQNLESLPDGGLPESLGSLIILHCQKIKRRCRVRDGEDWEGFEVLVLVFLVDYIDVRSYKTGISTTCFICPIFASDCYLISANLNNFV